MESKEANTLTNTIPKNKNVTLLIMAMIALLAAYAAYPALSNGGDATAAATKVEKETPATYLTLKNAAIGAVACGVLWALVRFKPRKNLMNQKPPQNNGGPNIWELNQKWQKDGLGADKFKPSTNKNTYGAIQQPANKPTEATVKEGPNIWELNQKWQKEDGGAYKFKLSNNKNTYDATQQRAKNPTDTTANRGPKILDPLTRHGSRWRR